MVCGGRLKDTVYLEQSGADSLILHQVGYDVSDSIDSRHSSFVSHAGNDLWSETDDSLARATAEIAFSRGRIAHLSLFLTPTSPGSLADGNATVGGTVLFADNSSGELTGGTISGGTTLNATFSHRGKSYSVSASAGGAVSVKETASAPSGTVVR